jgi:hypothetical protein
MAITAQACLKSLFQPARGLKQLKSLLAPYEHVKELVELGFVRKRRQADY